MTDGDAGGFAAMLAKELALLQDRVVYFYSSSLESMKQENRESHSPRVRSQRKSLRASFKEDLAIGEEIDVVLSEKEPTPANLQPGVECNGDEEKSSWALKAFSGTRASDIDGMERPSQAIRASDSGGTERTSRTILGSRSLSLDSMEFSSEGSHLGNTDLTRMQRRWGKFTCKLLARDNDGERGGATQRLFEEAAVGRWDLHAVWSLRTRHAELSSRRLLLPVSMRTRRAQCVSVNLGGSIRVSRLLDSRHGDFLESNTCLRTCTVDPDSLRWSCWASLGVLILVVDFFAIPLELAGLIDQFPIVASLCAFLYWALDMPVSLVTGYHSDGLVEMRPSMTIMNYGRGWFFPDLVILVLDIVYLSSVGVILASGGNFLRIFRMVRVLRFCRARKIYILYKALFDRLFSIYMVLTLNLLALIGFMLMLTHWVACIWYGISSRVASEETWSESYGPGETDHARDRIFNYVLALHWALCQFAPATTNVSARNLYERAFAALIAMLSLIVFSSFISNVTNAVNQLKSATVSKMAEHTRLRDFFLRMHVSTDLGHRIQRFFNHNYNTFACPVHECDVKAFRDLPETLKIRLHDEIYLPMIHRHEVFEYYGHHGRQTLSRICHSAFVESFHYADQDMFIEATEAQKMRLVMKGRAEYYGPCGSVIVDSKADPTNTGIAQGWISDAGLWLVWEHAGRLTAHTSCQVIELDCDTVRAILAKYGGPMFKALKIYAILFLSYVEDIAENGDGPVTDAPIPKDATLEILAKGERFLNAGIWDSETRMTSARENRTFGSVFRAVMAPSMMTNGIKILNRLSFMSIADREDGCLSADFASVAISSAGLSSAALSEADHARISALSQEERARTTTFSNLSSDEMNSYDPAEFTSRSSRIHGRSNGNSTVDDSQLLVANAGSLKSMVSESEPNSSTLESELDAALGAALTPKRLSL